MLLDFKKKLNFLPVSYKIIWNPNTSLRENDNI